MQHVSHVKPFISILVIIFTLFSLVFFKMEVRRMGYAMLKEVQQYKKLKDLHRLKGIKYAELGQIIQISGEKIALKQ